MTNRADAVLDRIRRHHGPRITLGIGPAYRALLEHLGNPQNRLPPVLHVAGTNGKGSTCAFARALIEAAGLKAHVYTSPHLLRVHERIVLAGTPIGDDELTQRLEACESLAVASALSPFEVLTAVAFHAFAEHPADVAIIEVGLGGRLDATNVVDHPVATAIARISFDHSDVLGPTLGVIAREKAGIMRAGVPCCLAPQPSEEARAALLHAAEEQNAPAWLGGRDWQVQATDPHDSSPGFTFTGPEGLRLTLPTPALVGAHQRLNAGLALAMLQAAGLLPPEAAAREAMRKVRWPARLQRLDSGPFVNVTPPGWEIWLDGGHNDSAGEALAAQATVWQAEDGANPRPLAVVWGMLARKNPEEFLAPLAPFITALRAVPIAPEALHVIEGEGQCFSPDALASQAYALGVSDSASASDTPRAILSAVVACAGQAARAGRQALPGRVLITGSLYLARDVLQRGR